MQDVIDAMLSHPTLKPLHAHPSVSYGAHQLYARGVWEEDTKSNLARPITTLLEEAGKGMRWGEGQGNGGGKIDRA